MKKFTLADIPQRISVRPNPQDGIQNFGDGNVYPQITDNAVKSSGRAIQCAEERAKFIRGKGFKDPFYKEVVNRKGHTVDAFFSQLIDDYSIHKYCVAHCNYDMNGDIVEWTALPAKEWRLGEEDELTGKVSVLKHHPDWGREKSRNFKKELIKEYPVYNPIKEVVLAQIGDDINSYTGQILWFSKKGLKYVESIIDPVFHDVLSDDEAKKGRYANITTNFMASQIMRIAEFANSDDRKAFKKMLDTFCGAAQQSRVMVMEEADPNNSPFKLEKVDIQNGDGRHEKTEAAVSEAIRQQFNVPPVLLGDREPGKLAPSQQEMKDAFAAMNSRTADERIMFERLFTEIFSHWHDPNINPEQDYSIDELQFGEEAILVERLQVGGTQAMMTVLTDGNIQPEQKVNILQIVFGLSEEDAIKIVPSVTPKQDA